MALTNEEIKWATMLAMIEPRLGDQMPPPSGNYLTFYSPDGEFTLSTTDNYKSWDGVLEWSTDTQTWIEWTWNVTISSTNGYLYLRGIGNGWVSKGNAWILEPNVPGGSIECIGNIENLLDYSSVADGVHPRMLIDCFRAIFYGCTSLTKAPELPATTLAIDCYMHMFRSCTSLTKAPELPATTLAISCYEGMFEGCTSLTKAPELPATTLAGNCYSSMFLGCTSLTKAPELPVTTLSGAYCYSSMFRRCTSLTKAPELPATTLTSQCYRDMFEGCTSLTKAPELPATTLSNGCYAEMFYGCTSLTGAIKLPATTLPIECYYRMFRGCTGIHLSTVKDPIYIYSYRIPTSGTATSASRALTDMFTATGGPFTGTPSINTTYYTDNEPV